MDLYEKKYKEALDKAQRFYNNSVAITKKGLEDIFPELAESEDERIKNLIYCLIRDRSDFGKMLEANGCSVDKALAWLEKQGKNNMGISEATKQKLEDNLNKALEKETPESWSEFLNEQGEQKPVEEVNGEDYGIDGLYAAMDILNKTLGQVEGYQSDDGILEHKAAMTAVKKLYKQNQWKPTIEQIMALEVAANDGYRRKIDKDILTELSEQLKRL